MNHEQVRVILNRDAEIPPEVEREDGLVRWADSVYGGVMRVTAAGVLEDQGSLEKAASVLWWAGFAVPAGYFSEEEAGELPSLDSEEALRAWVEREGESIERARHSIGFYMAGRGKLLDDADEYITRAEPEEESVDNELITRLCSNLSPKGQELLRELEDAPEEEHEAFSEEAKTAIEEVMRRIQREAPADWEPIKKIMGLRAQAHRSRLEEHQEGLKQAELARGVLYRAQELLREEGAEPREDMVLKDAIAVLERHAESPPEELDLFRSVMVPETL